MTSDADPRPDDVPVESFIESAAPPAPVSPGECRRVLGDVAWLSHLGEGDFDALSPLLLAREYAAGATLFYEDDEGGAAYFLASGAVEVFKSNQSGKKMPLVVLRDIGLLIGERRTATARALNAVRMLEMERAAFEKAIQDGNMAVLRLSLAFARVLAQRLTTTDEKLFELFQNDISDLLYRQLSELQSRLLTRWTG